MVKHNSDYNFYVRSDPLGLLLPCASIVRLFFCSEKVCAANLLGGRKLPVPSFASPAAALRAFVPVA
jgi:hypothetical protein